MPAYYTRHELGVLDIFFKNTSNILKYAQLYSSILNISLLGRYGGLMGEAGRRTDNPIYDKKVKNPTSGEIVLTRRHRKKGDSKVQEKERKNALSMSEAR